MLDDIVIVPVEISNNDLIIIIEISKRLGIPRNATIRKLINEGAASMIGNVEDKTSKKRGGKK